LDLRAHDSVDSHHPFRMTPIRHRVNSLGPPTREVGK
jgi:hypothetical protein